MLEGRYIYNIMPIAAAGAGFCMLACSRQIDFRALFGLILALGLFASLRTVPDYIYDEHRAYNEAVAAHADAKCLYVTDYYAGVTQDMLQLMAFPEVFVTGDPDSPALAEYLDRAESEELVVYIDIDGIWGSGLDPDETLDRLEAATGYAGAEHLYQYALSDTYVLRR